MTYTQITSSERYMLAALHAQGYCPAEIGRSMGRHRGTISRELERNRSAHDGAYRPSRAVEHTGARRSRSRRNQHFGTEAFAQVDELIKEKLSPEQVSGRLCLNQTLRISTETIYQHIWRNQRAGGTLHTHLRCARKRRRKRYARYDSRGRLAGKRHISERPAEVETREEAGHWEIDTVMGHASKHCIVTLVERTTGLVLIGQLPNRTAAAVTRRTISMMKAHDGPFKTITSDNGTEFHDYRKIEQTTGTTIYFATPYHSWERGTNENANGLILQYLPKRHTMRHLTQRRCNSIAFKLNSRPRKRHGYKTPLECIYES